MTKNQTLLEYRVVFGDGSSTSFKPNKRSEAIAYFESAQTPSRLLRVYGEEMDSRAGPATGLSRDALNRKLMALYQPYAALFPYNPMSEVMQDRYGLGETRLMSVEQLADFVEFVELRLSGARP